jgi:hypothetical protein
MKKVRDRLVKTEFLILGDWSARISDLHINSAHTHIWDSFYMTDSRRYKSYENRNTVVKIKWPIVMVRS